MKIFLDDIRIPEDCLGYMYKRIGKDNPIYLEEWVIVRNYQQFKYYITKHVDEITHISFDYDLGEDVARELVESGAYSKRKARQLKKESMSGYDCAKWLKDFYKNRPLPILYVHSMNPVGTENIINLFK